MRLRSLAFAAMVIPWFVTPPVFYPVTFDKVWSLDGEWTGYALLSHDGRDVVLPARLSMRAKDCSSAKQVYFHLEIGPDGQDHRVSKGSGRLPEDSDAIMLQEERVISAIGAFAEKWSGEHGYMLFGDSDRPEKLYVENTIFFSYSGFKIYLEKPQQPGQESGPGD